MIVIVNQLSIKSDWADKVEAAFLENIKGLDAQPGFAGFRFLKPENPDESPCLVQVHWQSEADFETWKASPHFKQSHVGMRELKDAFYAPPRLVRYSVSEMAL